MLESKPTLNGRKTFYRSATMMTTNENVIEKINLDDYKNEFKIKRSNLSYYYICKHIKTNKLYFMKVSKKIDILQSKTVEHLTNEYRILGNIYHPFIIDLKGINNTDPITLNFLFEFIPGGSLNSLLKSYKRLPIESVKFYLASLITIIDYLHKKNIIYRDFRPDNILINSNGYIKLFDFSFGKKLENESDMTYTTCGTPEYYSPEMINKTGYNISTDFWQLGILLYELLVGCTPFMDIEPLKMYQKINKSKIMFPKTMNKNAKTLIKHLLIVDVNKRLGCTKKGIIELIDNPFFEGFDWKGLLYRNLEAPYVPVVNGPTDTTNYRKIDDATIGDNDFIEVDKEKDPFYNW